MVSPFRPVWHEMFKVNTCIFTVTLAGAVVQKGIVSQLKYSMMNILRYEVRASSPWYTSYIDTKGRSSISSQ